MVLAILAAVLGFGFTTDFGSEDSAVPVVQSFLLDWEQKQYAAAAQLTNGNTALVSAQLAAAYQNVDATGLFFSLSSITQDGHTAKARFHATVDLADGDDLQWKYEGSLGLVNKSGKWLINWAPSVIEPKLQAGDRLAVLTTYPARGQITDSSGKSLIGQSTVYHVGVYPGQLSGARATANEFARLTGLNPTQVLGQISSAPPRAFLSMLTLSPQDFATLWPSLSRVPGLTWQSAHERLFNYDGDNAIGSVGTENSGLLRAEGVGYQPGATVGLSGLEAAYQNTLTGSPGVSVIVVNSHGNKVATLSSSLGSPAKALQTTINGQFEAAANDSLASLPVSAGIVAVDAATGRIVAIAGHEAGNLALPMPSDGLVDAQIQPGITFTVVSAAALLGNGLAPSSPLPCQNVANVGGQTFTYSPGQSSSATFASDFASGCATAFATVSMRLTQPSLEATEKAFGIEAPWNLRVPSFSGSVSATTGEAGLASQAIGGGGVLMSPLGMAMVAADVDSGVGHTPTLVSSDSPSAWRMPLSAAQMTALRGLMRDAVQSGSARAANLSGVPVYGQAGVVQTGTHDYLSWFVGYRGELAFTVIEATHTQAQAAAALAATFLSSMSSS